MKTPRSFPAFLRSRFMKSCCASCRPLFLNVCATTFLLFSFAAMAEAGQIEAREVARQNNCTPKKIEVVKQTLGMDGKTTYSISCVMAKVKEDATSTGPVADTLLVECVGPLCTPLRRATATK